MKRVLLGVVVAVVAAIAATLWVGARVREDTVVPNPYEEGLKLNRPADAPAGAGHADHHPGPLAGLELVLSPRPLRTMRELDVEVRWAGPADAELELSFAMDGMDMGDNVVRLSSAGQGRWRGKAVLVRCPSGRTDWTATVRVVGPRGVLERKLPFQVEE